MKSIFRLYSSIHSSYFDLISGDKETQQTKGLGLLLAKSDRALQAFLNLDPIKSKVGKINLKSIDRLIVNCELISHTDTKYRADIVLRMYSNGKPYKMLLIEAKSINKGTTVFETNKQIQKYIDNQVFEEMKEFGQECYGITLTKLPSYTKHKSLISVTWGDIVEAFYYAKPNKNTLLDDYFNFLTNINGTMKFYEKEVYSIPTAQWSQKAIDDYKIYECPNEGAHLIKQKPLYLTFRKSGGGEMDKLFKVEDIIIMNFSTDYETLLKDENYSPEIRKRVQEYVEYMLREKIWPEKPSDEKQVFLLSENTIDLNNKPKPKRNNSFRSYYELADLLNKEIV